MATALALVITGSATAEDEGRGIDPNQGRNLVEVNLPNKAAAIRLQLNDDQYAVDFNDHYLRHNADGTVTVTVFGTAEELDEFAAAGFDIGTTIEGPATWKARLADRTEDAVAEQRADAAASGLAPAGLVAPAAEGAIIVLRVDTFSNYAGRFLSVEAKDRDANLGLADIATMSLSWNTGSGTPIDSDPRTLNVNIDGDTTPDTYIEHRILVRTGDAASAAPTMVRIGSSRGPSSVEAPANVWLGGGLPPMRSTYLKDFTTRYMDPTEVYGRFDELAAEFPNITEMIKLPYKTNGYQRKAQATFATTGTTLQGATAAGTSAIRLASTSGLAIGMRIWIDTGANEEQRTIATVVTPNPASPAPNVTLTEPLALAHANGALVMSPGSSVAGSAAPAAVVLTTRAWGHEGGNDVTAELRNPGVANSPLIVLTLGTNILVTLSTDATGNLTSTATQVIDAINAHPAASALVKAFTYRGNAGAGIVQPRSKMNLSDFLKVVDANGVELNAHVKRGPFEYSMMRITREVGGPKGPKVGVFLYCQQHAREWATPLTCLETAEQLLRNYATDPATRKLVDQLEIYVLPSSNPDGSHYSMYNFASQRRNMTNHCVVGGQESDDPNAAEFWTPRLNPSTDPPAPYTNSDPGSRNAWGVDLNRNNTFGTIFDGYIGASYSCTSDVYTGPAEASEPEIKNELWIADTFKNIKFSNNIHSFGGYFMWAPGTYLPDRGEGAAVHANIGVEKYFFEAGDQILNRIKEVRDTVILPERTGPIADVLYSAAGNSADEHWYLRGVIAYSFETGADRFGALQSTTVAAAAAAGATAMRVGNRNLFTPLEKVTIDPGTPNQEVRTVLSVSGNNPSSPNPNLFFTEPLQFAHAVGAVVQGQDLVQSGVGFQPDYATEGKFEALEFSAGNYGLLESARAYANDVRKPKVVMTGAFISKTPITTTFQYVNEPSVIRYTTDGSAPDNTSALWDSTGPREPGQSFVVSSTTTFRWLATDIKGNQSTGSKKFVINTKP